MFPVSSFLIETAKRDNSQINPTGEERRVVISYRSNFFVHFFSFVARWHTPIYLRRKEQPSVRRALPPVGWQRTVEQPAQMTTVWACEKTVVIVKQPGHLTSMKKERGAGTRVCFIHQFCPSICEIIQVGVFFIDYRTLSLCLRASDWGVGLRRSTARTWREAVSQRFHHPYAHPPSWHIASAV